MRTYFVTLVLFWRTSFAAELEYRSNFVFAVLGSLGSLVGSVFGMTLFYQRGYALGGWEYFESMMVLGLFMLLTGFTNTVLTPNLNRIVTQVEDGTLDFVLLKPIDSQFWVSLRQISPWGLPDALFGLILVVVSAWQTGVKATWLWLALPTFLCGLVTLYGMWFLLAATSIWFVKVYNVTEVLRGLLDAGRYPISAYPAAYRFFFTFLVPVVFLTTVPAEVALGRASSWGLLTALGLSFVFWFAARWFWRFALRFYTSASS
ncbi:MAG: ABC transporter permease [Myxococcota bacterium]